MHKITKLHVRADAKNQATNEEIAQSNNQKAKQLTDLGFISGGVWGVEKGDSYTGHLRATPTVGEPVFLDGSEWFRSSVVEAITPKTDKSWVIKTANSYYLLEDVSR